jgi:hypothetical protein
MKGLILVPHSNTPTPVWDPEKLGAFKVWTGWVYDHLSVEEENANGQAGDKPESKSRGYAGSQPVKVS